MNEPVPLDYACRLVCVCCSMITPMTMKISFARLIFFFAIAVFTTQCADQPGNTGETEKPEERPQTDQEFVEQLIPGQSFAIDGRKDNVIEGKNGTIVICPKGCFVDARGNVVEDSIRVELREALSLEDMILQNLSTTSNGALLETDGMVHLRASSGNTPLQINKAIPIRFEIPTFEKVPGMMAYRGETDASGNINWVDPRPIENVLNAVDIFSLDFLPEGFEQEVTKEMKSTGTACTTNDVYDLYYRNATVDFISLFFDVGSLTATSVNEPYYNNQKKVVNGTYTTDSYTTESEEAKTVTRQKSHYGIDPAKIKVIRSANYQNTLLATREFEARLRVIFTTCDDKVLEVYTRNLHKNLYELDSIAAGIASDSSAKQAFRRFQELRCTNVRQADIYAALLKNHYDARLARVKEELATMEQERKKSLDKEIAKEERTIEKYREVLWKREKYRMETYGFNWSDTGWVNVDIGISPKGWSMQKSERIAVTNGNEFDRVYSYLVFTTIKSIYRLNTTDNMIFFPGNATDRQMIMPKKGRAVVVCVAYKGEQPHLAIQEFELSGGINISLTPTPTNPQTLRGALGVYDRYQPENKISKDLQYMDELYRIEQRRKTRQREREFHQRLYYLAFPCEAGDVVYVMEEVK